MFSPLWHHYHFYLMVLTLYRSCLPFHGIVIIRSLSFLFLDGFEQNANGFVAIKSGSTVLGTGTVTILYIIILYYCNIYYI